MSTSHEESSMAGPPQQGAPDPSGGAAPSDVAAGPVAQTVHGPVRGSAEGRVNSWKGIRYAAAPVGDLRWRAPQPPEPWTEIVDAQHFGAAAPQGANGIITIAPGVPFDEDCLSLNVWAASRIAPGDRVPVMVWVHGGAYALGSSSQPLYDGGVLAADGDVIVVTLNYRLGALGFLDLTSLNGGEGADFDSNLALRDVLLALEWVRDSIAGFGGDPDQVTLFGESAGGGIVTTLLAVPAAAGLFHRAIAQSSPSTSVYRSSQATAVTEMFLDELGAGRDPAELRAASVDDIVAAGITVYQKVPLQLPGRLAYSPLVDGDLVPDYPLDVIRAGKAHPVPLLIGTNKDEAALFRRMKSPLLPITKDTIDAMFADMAEERPDRVLPDRATVLAAYTKLPKSAKGVGIARDIAFRMPTLWLVEGHSAVAPVWLYRFDYSTPMLRLAQVGASHATELPYLWGHLSSGPKDPTFRLGGMGAALKISARMRERWTAFAVSGEPQAPRADAPLWPAYRPDDARSTLVIDRHDAVIDDLDGALRAAWGDDVLSFP